MTSSEVIEVFNQAAEHALIHGCGLIRLTNTPTGLMVDVIYPEEYLNLSVSLQWAAENSSLLKKPQ